MDQDYSAVLQVVSGAAAAAASSVAFYYVRSRRKRFAKRQVFISFASDDREVAREIIKAVEEAGYTPWASSESIKPGENIDGAIERAIRGSGAVLFIAPRPEGQSEGARAEGNQLAIYKNSRALTNEISPVLPIVVDGSRYTGLPEWLRDTLALRYDDTDWSDHLKSYLRAAFRS
jgi:hypothetical protein